MLLPDEIINNIFSYMSSPTADLIKYAVDDCVLHFMHNAKYKVSFEEGMDDAVYFDDFNIWIYNHIQNINLNKITNLIKNVLAYLSGYLVILEEGVERYFIDDMEPEERLIWIDTEIEVIRNLIEDLLFLRN